MSTESRGHLGRKLVARRENLFGACRQYPPGEALDVDRDPASTLDVPEKLAKARSQIENNICSVHVTLKEMPAQDLPDGVFSVAIGFGKPCGVERIKFHVSLRAMHAVASAMRSKPTDRATSPSATTVIHPASTGSRNANQ